MEVDSTDSSEPPKLLRGKRWEKSLNDRIDKFGVHELVSLVRKTFHENWPQSREMIVTHGINFRLRDLVSPGSTRHTRRPYARVGPREGGVRLVFYPRAIKLHEDVFREPIKEIPYTTWPENQKALEDPNTEIGFILTPEEWEIHKEKLTVLVQSIYQAWQNSASGG